MRSIRVGIIGGGVAGLSAAYEASLDERVAEVVVFESTDRLGGKLQTVEIAGASTELGADSFLARVPAVIDLARDLGIESELIAPATTSAYILHGGKLRPMPSGPVLGVPRGWWPMLRSGLAGPSVAMAGLKDRLFPSRIVDDDLSVRSLITSRLGGQVADRYTAPLLGGVYSCDISHLSAAACTPEALLAARAGRSLLPPAGTGSKATGPVFMSFRRGLRQLVEALSRRTLTRTGAEGQVRSVTAVADGYRVTAGSSDEEFSCVILATPAFVTSELIRSLAPHVGEALERIEYSDVAHLLLGFEPETVHLPPGSGFLSADGGPVRGCTWLSQKWDLPSDLTLIRCSVDPSQNDDTELTVAVLEDLQRVLGIEEPPALQRIQRWSKGLPCYRVGHLRLVDEIESGLSTHRGLAVTGAAMRGVGIAACVKQGRETARNTLERVLSQR